MPVREDTYPEPLACEVGWPVPLLAAFISPVFPLGTHLVLDEYSGRGDGGAGGALAPPLFAKMKFAHLYFTVLR